mmetsp:Transcript_70287/g.121812  ORF Transcript_70287/g.121812 Transcript_70287/m.121812 type:complete len:205 (-) Transcript_70287:577-1191(-)
MGITGALSAGSRAVFWGMEANLTRGCGCLPVTIVCVRFTVDSRGCGRLPVTIVCARFGLDCVSSLAYQDFLTTTCNLLLDLMMSAIAMADLSSELTISRKSPTSILLSGWKALCRATTPSNTLTTRRRVLREVSKFKPHFSDADFSRTVENKPCAVDLRKVNVELCLLGWCILSPRPVSTGERCGDGISCSSSSCSSSRAVITF